MENWQNPYKNVEQAKDNGAQVVKLSTSFFATDPRKTIQKTIGLNAPGYLIWPKSSEDVSKYGYCKKFRIINDHQELLSKGTDTATFFEVEDQSTYDKFLTESKKLIKDNGDESVDATVKSAVKDFLLNAISKDENYFVQAAIHLYRLISGQEPTHSIWSTTDFYSFSNEKDFNNFKKCYNAIFKGIINILTTKKIGNILSDLQISSPEASSELSQISNISIPEILTTTEYKSGLGPIIEKYSNSTKGLQIGLIPEDSYFNLTKLTTLLKEGFENTNLENNNYNDKEINLTAYGTNSLPQGYNSLIKTNNKINTANLIAISAEKIDKSKINNGKIIIDDNGKNLFELSVNETAIKFIKNSPHVICIIQKINSAYIITICYRVTNALPSAEARKAISEDAETEAKKFLFRYLAGGDDNKDFAASATLSGFSFFYDENYPKPDIYKFKNIDNSYYIATFQQPITGVSNFTVTTSINTVLTDADNNANRFYNTAKYNFVMNILYSANDFVENYLSKSNWNSSAITNYALTNYTLLPIPESDTEAKEPETPPVEAKQDSSKWTNKKDIRSSMRDMSNNIYYLADYNWGINSKQNLKNLNIEPADFPYIRLYELQPNKVISTKRIARGLESATSQILSSVGKSMFEDKNGKKSALGTILSTNAAKEAGAAIVSGVSRGFSDGDSSTAVNVDWFSEILEGDWVGQYDIPYFGQEFIQAGSASQWSMGNVADEHKLLQDDSMVNVQDIPIWKYTATGDNPINLKNKFFLLNEDLDSLQKNFKFLMSFCAGSFWVQSTTNTYRPPNIYRAIAPGRFVLPFAGLNVTVNYIGKIKKYSMEEAKKIFGSDFQFNIMTQTDCCYIPDAYEVNFELKDVSPQCFNVFANYFSGVNDLVPNITVNSQTKRRGGYAHGWGTFGHV